MAYLEGLEGPEAESWSPGLGLLGLQVGTNRNEIVLDLQCTIISCFWAKGKKSTNINL